jgi:L-ribulose-5-phosphate 3-epimerase
MPTPCPLTRRAWLTRMASGLGAAAIGSLSAPAARAQSIHLRSVPPVRPIGIFTHIIPGNHSAKSQIARETGFDCVQWYPALDKDDFSEATFKRVGTVYRDARIPIAAVAGYANLFDPRPDVRKTERDRLSTILKLAPASGCSLVTTETGTLNPARGWHPDNTRPEIWNEFVDLVGNYVVEAERAGSVLVLEAYTKNICRDANDISRLLQAIGNPPSLRWVMDPFNIVHESELTNVRPVIDQYFNLIAPMCPVVHAKDLLFVDGEKTTPRSGTGIFDWPYYAELLQRLLPTTPLVLEHLKWPEVTETLAFVKQELARASTVLAPIENPPISNR